MPLGRPEQFFDKVQVRLKAIDSAIARFHSRAAVLKKSTDKSVDEHTLVFLKGLGNDIELLSAFRELFFNSRELLDVLLGRLNRLTKTTKSPTPKDLIPFAKRLMDSRFDHIELPIFAFLKTNITYIFHIRKIRNEIKHDPSSVEFRFNTNQFEAHVRVSINPEETDLIRHLDILCPDEILRKKEYSVTWKLDVLFPEMREFWNVALESFRQSEKLFVSRASGTTSSSPAA